MKKISVQITKKIEPTVDTNVEKGSSNGADVDLKEPDMKDANEGNENNENNEHGDTVVHVSDDNEEGNDEEGNEEGDGTEISPEPKIIIKQKIKPISCVKKTCNAKIEEPLRKRANTILLTHLSKYFTEEELETLEESIHRRAVYKAKVQGVLETYNAKFLSIYNSVLSTCCIHLDPESYANNTYLLAAIKAGTLKLTDVPAMSQQELYPKMWDKQLQYKKAQTQQLSIGAKVVTSKLIKCGRCGSDTTYTEVQTRSCDEAMTIKVQCPKCGNRFNI